MPPPPGYLMVRPLLTLDTIHWNGKWWFTTSGNPPFSKCDPVNCYRVQKLGHTYQYAKVYCVFSVWAGWSPMCPSATILHLNKIFINLAVKRLMLLTYLCSSHWIILKAAHVKEWLIISFTHTFKYGSQKTNNYEIHSKCSLTEQHLFHV